MTSPKQASCQVFALLLLAVFLGAPAANAALSKEESNAGHSAFAFAGRKDWGNALAWAKQSRDPVMVRLITWQYLLGSDSGADFSDITRFITENSGWPEQKRLRLRAEFSLRDNKTPDSEIIAWFKDNPPLTGVGKLALAEALLRTSPDSSERATALIRDAWKGGDFEESEEDKLLAAHGDMLHPEDDIARLDRLLWEEKLLAAKRDLPRLPQDYQALFQARIALIEDDKDAASLVENLPSQFRNDPGLTYDLLRFRASHGDSAGIREILMALPDDAPYPDKWWKYREAQIREAIGERDFDTAKKLLSDYGKIEGQNLSNAHWLKGWLMLRFLNEPEEAYEAFSKMFDDVRYPVSRARAAYWAGRAAEKLGDKKTAGDWYDSAKAYPTSFYGQLAAIRQDGDAPLHIPAPPAISREKKQAFEKDDLVRAAILCAELGERDMAGELINYKIETTDDPAIAALAADVGNKLGEAYLSVRGAKKASQQNIILVKDGYPAPKTPPALPIERPLALSIMRQESEFDARAKSPSGAVGMMQLLPGTARETARRNGLVWRIKRMIEPQYNMSLGSYYLGHLVHVYDDSYVLAIAAYNAGPGNVHQWIGNFGEPGKDPDNVIDWIEKIPFSETRNYVQRVLENLQVYRQIEAPTPPQLSLDKDLVR